MATEPLSQIVDEARRLLGAPSAVDVPIRLVGGLAVHIRAPEPFHPGLTREYKDIDLVTLKGRSKAVIAFLEAMGYEPQRQFNAMNGHERLLFHDLVNERQLDVFVGSFRMCHSIPMDERILLDPTSVPLAELLLTKLQVVKLNEKDLRDAIAIFHYHDVSDADGETISGKRAAELCASDWGLWRTSRMNVERVLESVDQYELSDGERAQVKERAARLWARIEKEPKSRSWRLRDRVGDRKQWYDDPEEVDT